MTKNKNIQNLCELHTSLNQKDIYKLIETSKSMESVASLMGADIFIDCITRDPDAAIVIAQAAPMNVPSLYTGSVIGQFAYRKNEPAVLRTLEIGMPTKDMMGITQENKNVLQSVSPIKNSKGDVLGVLIAEKDVTKDIQAKQTFSMLKKTAGTLMDALLTAKSSDQGIHQHLHEGIVVFDTQRNCTYANIVAQEIYSKLGFIDKLEGLQFVNLVLDDTLFQDVMDNKQMTHSEIKVGYFVLDLKYVLIDNQAHGLSGVVMMINDITDVKAKEKELVLKSVSISEIHHRIKNNLQTIASLLRLQSRRIDNKLAKESFSESINRVLSIATTHDILAEEGVDNVDIKTMLNRIKDCFGDHPMFINNNLKFSIAGDSFLINSDKAASIALVVNEVIQNCLKYAFQGRETGTIEVKICKGTMFSNISITDNGIGYDIEKVACESLGCKIIERIVSDKLKGRLTIESGEVGTKVLFDFRHESDGDET